MKSSTGARGTASRLKVCDTAPKAFGVALRYFSLNRRAPGRGVGWMKRYWSQADDNHYAASDFERQ